MPARRSPKPTPPPAGSAPPAGRDDPRLNDPRGAAQALRALLGQKVSDRLAARDLDRESAEELCKIGGLLEKLEGSGYDLKAAAVEVGARLADFVAAREPDPEKKTWLADTLAAFFLSLDSGRP